MTSRTRLNASFSRMRKMRFVVRSLNRVVVLFACHRFAFTFDGFKFFGLPFLCRLFKLGFVARDQETKEQVQAAAPCSFGT